jgi:rod shape-determining protein MreD
MQTVVFSRLHFFGVSPDLILVSIICFAVLERRERAIVFAAGSAFLQDILSFGIYLHTMTRVVISWLANSVKESFAGNEYSLAASFVFLFTPLALVIESGFHSVFGGRPFDIGHLLFTMLVATFYNLFMVPILFPILRKIVHG